MEENLNELVRIRMQTVDPDYYQEGEKGYVVLTPGLPAVAVFHKTEGKILFYTIGGLNLSGVDGLREWPPPPEQA